MGTWLATSFTETHEKGQFWGGGGGGEKLIDNGG